MQHTQQLFLEALKAALKNEQVEWNNKLEAQEWMDLFRMAEVHQILPMIYEAVYRSPAAGQADPQILAPAKAQMVRTVIMQTQKTGEFEPLYRYLRESGICPLVVKGIVCRNIYPNPDYRISGDEDLLIRPQEGEAVIVASNGREIVLNAETRHFFAYVPQGNTILSGTIAENMRMVKEDATDEEIIEALKIACAWEFVEKLPDTINSALGERGRGLSEGQAQRISIARAVLRNAPILLLDEATSALDVTTERKVLRNIIEQKPNKTCIVTTHRPSVLNMCQRVYRVMETKVTELDEEESSRMAMDF